MHCTLARWVTLVVCEKGALQFMDGGVLSPATPTPQICCGALVRSSVGHGAQAGGRNVIAPTSDSKQPDTSLQSTEETATKRGGGGEKAPKEARPTCRDRQLPGQTLNCSSAPLPMRPCTGSQARSPPEGSGVPSEYRSRCTEAEPDHVFRRHPFRRASFPAPTLDPLKRSPDIAPPKYPLVGPDAPHDAARGFEEGGDGTEGR